MRACGSKKRATRGCVDLKGKGMLRDSWLTSCLHRLRIIRNALLLAQGTCLLVVAMKGKGKGKGKSKGSKRLVLFARLAWLLF